MAEKDLEVWVRDRLHDLVDFSDRTLAQYILAMAKKATTTNALMSQLENSGIPTTPASQAFAQELIKKLPRKGSGGGATTTAKSTGGGTKQLTKAEEMRLSQQYKMIDSDDEEFVAAIGSKTSSSSSSSSSKKEKRQKHARKKHGEEDEEEDTTTVVRKRGREDGDASTKADAKAEEAAKEEELDEDIRERDAFVQRLLEREEKKTKKKGGDGGLTAEQIMELATKGSVKIETEADLEDARKYSRREYLKKREDKKLQLMEKELREEEVLFEGVELTKQEKERLEVKRKVLAMAKDGNRFEIKDDVSVAHHGSSYYYGVVKVSVGEYWNKKGSGLELVLW